MPRTRKDEAPVLVDVPVLEGRYVELDDYTVAFETFREDADGTPLFRGLPDDRCQCPHWGYVLQGAITVRYADGTQETTGAGELYYWPAGHTGWTDQGVTFLEFSPAEQLQPVLDHLGTQLSAS